MSRAIFQAMPQTQDDLLPSGDIIDLEQSEDFLFFKNNLNVKKPLLLPLELQIALKREKEKQDLAAAEAKLRELEELES